jgi:hypothetical protein
MDNLIRLSLHAPVVSSKSIICGTQDIQRCSTALAIRRWHRRIDEDFCFCYPNPDRLKPFRKVQFWSGSIKKKPEFPVPQQEFL